jgi:phage-related holin
MEAVLDGNQFLNMVAAAVYGLWSDPVVWVIIIHILINTLLSVLNAINKGWFTLNKFWEFLYKKILPALGVYIVFSVLGAPVGWGGFHLVVGLLIESWLIASTLQTLKEMGLPIPDGLTKVRTDLANDVSRGVLPPDS